MSDQQSRLNELTLELIGAEARANVLERVWSSAGPEMIASLQGAIVASLEKEMRTGTWASDKLIQGGLASAVAELARAYVAEHRDRIIASFDRELDRALFNLASEQVKAAVNRALNEAKYETGRVIADRLATVVEQLRSKVNP